VPFLALSWKTEILKVPGLKKPFFMALMRIREVRSTPCHQKVDLLLERGTGKEKTFHSKR
jgi:hypothetical protein